MRRPHRWFSAPDVSVLFGVGMAIAAVAAVRPAVSYRALDLGAGPAFVGAAAGSFALFSLFAAIPAGLLVDRFGAKPFFIAGTGTIAAAAVVDAFAAVLFVLPLGQALLGLGQLGSQLAGQTSAARGRGGADRDLRFGRFAVAVSIGQLVGPLAGGLILDRAEQAGMDAPTTPVFLFGAALALGATAVGATSRAWAPAAGDARADGSQARPSVSSMLRITGMRHELATSIAVLTAVDLLVAYLPLVGREHGLSPAFVGLLLSVRGLATLASRLALPVLMASLGRRMTLGGNLFAAGLAFAALSVATRPAVFLALVVVIGFGLGVGQPITASWVAGQAPADRVAAALALRLTGNRAGQLLLPAVAGLAAGLGGTTLVFGAAGLALIGSTLSVRRISLDV
ncbi:MAG TPA: MFS transporter [Jiangellaceae bacterium]